MSQQPPHESTPQTSQPGDTAPRERRVTLVPTVERRRLFDRRRQPSADIIHERRRADRRSVTTTAAGFTGVSFARSAKLDLDEFFDDGHQIIDEVLANSVHHITIAYTPTRAADVDAGSNVSVAPAPVEVPPADEEFTEPEFAPAQSAPTTAAKDTKPVIAHTNDLLPRGRVAPSPVTLLGNRPPAAGQTSVVPDPRRFIDFYSRKIGWVYEIDSPKWGLYSGWRPTLNWTKKAGKRMMNLIDSWGEPDDPDEFV